MEERSHHTYRLCPCSPMDVEGIQSWLEDLARVGLILETDGEFLGIFSFRKETPKQLRYRLTPVREKKGFWDDNDTPDQEEKDYSAQCGWEYVVHYSSFHIYRSGNTQARPLHTDPAVQALAMDALRKQQRSLLISQLLYWTILILLRTNGRLGLFLSGTLIGPVYLFALVGMALWLALTMLLRLIRLSQYNKRILSGDSLEQKSDWKRSAAKVFAGKLIPPILSVALIGSLLVHLGYTMDRRPLSEVWNDPPFASLADVFPDGDLDHQVSMGDYNTAIVYSTGLSANIEWNEASDIVTEDGSYYGILRLQHFNTKADWIAKGVARDIYAKEKNQYHGKRFEDIPAPETEFDSVKVFDSYGTLHVLIQQDHRVYHAVVLLSNQTQKNQWGLWLQAMEEKLL